MDLVATVAYQVAVGSMEARVVHPVAVEMDEAKEGRVAAKAASVA